MNVEELGTRTSTAESAAGPAGAAIPAQAGDAAPAPATVEDSDRRALLDLLIYAWDRAKSPGVWERLAAGLEPLGITVLRPDGELFDPTVHEAGGVEPTDDDALVGTIAETELVGFADRGRLVREPIVVVYRRG